MCPCYTYDFVTCKRFDITEEAQTEQGELNLLVNWVKCILWQCILLKTINKKVFHLNVRFFKKVVKTIAFEVTKNILHSP